MTSDLRSHKPLARILTAALAGAFLLSATAAEAQRTRRGRGPAVSEPSIRNEPIQTRGAATYGAPAGYRGIITSSTPNADGNLGGPGTGGAGGGGK